MPPPQPEPIGLTVVTVAKLKPGCFKVIKTAGDAFISVLGVTVTVTKLVAAAVGLLSVNMATGSFAGEGGGGAEVLAHTNVTAAVPGGASALSQVALRWTITVRKLLQLESP